MTSDQVCGLMLIGLGLMILSWRKKRQNARAQGEIVFIEMIEMIEVRKSRKAPEFAVNLAIVAAIVTFIWVMNRS
jgi:hypothetical protein